MVRRLQFLRALRRAALLLQVRNSEGDTRPEKEERSLLPAAKPRRSMDGKMTLRGREVESEVIFNSCKTERLISLGLFFLTYRPP